MKLLALIVILSVIAVNAQDFNDDDHLDIIDIDRDMSNSDEETVILS